MRRHLRTTRTFTLLELLIVLLILAAVAASAASMVGEADEQFRFEETRSRLERIRRAVIGGADGTAQQPAGFVADLGRFPANLRELLEQGSLPAWAVDSDGIGAGWRGPYLNALPSLSGGTRELFDGWGNTPAAGDESNFGWLVSLPGTSLSVQSLGRDRAAGGAATYDRDYPAAPLVLREDCFADLDTLAITIRNDGGAGLTNETLRLRIRAVRDGAPLDLLSDERPNTDLPQGTATPAFTFTAADRFAAWGVRLVEVQRDNAGTWEALGAQSPQRLELRPRAATAVTWRIP